MLTFLISITSVTTLEPKRCEPAAWIDAREKKFTRMVEQSLRFEDESVRRSAAGTAYNLVYGGEVVRGHYRNFVNAARREGRDTKHVEYEFSVSTTTTDEFSCDVREGNESEYRALTDSIRRFVYVNDVGTVELHLRLVKSKRRLTA